MKILLVCLLLLSCTFREPQYHRKHYWKQIDARKDGEDSVFTYKCQVSECGKIERYRLQKIYKLYKQ